MEKNKESVENNEKSMTNDDLKINYKGWKVMPFIIGKQHKACTTCNTLHT